MGNKIMRRGLAIALSMAMLLTGVQNPGMSVHAAEKEVTVFEDTMDSKDGWNTEWSVSNSENVTDKINNIGGTVNATKGWNIWSQSAQTVTFSKTVDNLEAGNYKASVEIVGGAVSSGKISIYEGTAEKVTKNMESFGSWPSGGSDTWAATVTDAAAVAGTSVTIKIVMDLADGGWFWMDNVILKKITQGEDGSDEAQKEAKRTELKQLMDGLEALNLADYKRAGRAVLKIQLANAKEVYADNAKTLAELEEAVTSLKNAKDALIDVNAVDAVINVEKVEGIDSDFIRGVDISTYASLMDSGVEFKDWEGNPISTGTPFFEFLKEAGINYVRLRIWNDPYDAAGHGYGAGNCDVEKAAKIGKWATDAGMKVLLDFHYSDFWADPGRQVVPKAWAGLAIDAKADALEEYTKESLNTILDAGVDVGMVQVGNETNGKLCGENNWPNMIKLFAAGSKAIRSVSTERNKDILIAVHFANPEKVSNMKGFAKQLSDGNIDYDVFGSSYYPFWHGTLANLTSVLSDISKTYNKKVIVAETSWAYTLEDGDGQKNVIRSGVDVSAYDISVQGQAEEVRNVIEAVKDVGDAGLGVFYWEPAWIPVNVYDAQAENAAEVLAANKQAWENFGSGWASSYSISYDPNVDETNYGGSEWDNQALFDFEGYPLPSLNVFSYVETGAAVPPYLESYKITYQLNGGTNHASNPAKYTLADEVVFKAPSRTGYTFEGWYADSSFTKPLKEIPEATTGDLTLYAKWKVSSPTICQTSYKIIYKLNGGTNNKNNPVGYTTKKVTLKNPVRKNYTFGGWYLDSKFKNKVTSISPTSKKEITVYAKWNKVSVKKASVKKAVNNSTKKIKVTIKKVAGAKGYRLQYSTDKKFKKNVKTVKPTTKTSLTLSKLKKGKTYYVRVCAYRLDSGNNKIFGKYGSYKKVKVKK